MITDEQKSGIAKAVYESYLNLNSWRKVAIYAGASASTLSNSMQKPELWHLVNEAMWRKVASNVGYKLQDQYWQLVDTTNTNLMQTYLEQAQFQSLFMAISHPAGEGKSTGVEMYKQCHDNVFYLEAEESWTHRAFVMRLAEILGVQTRRYMRVADLTDEIVISLKTYAARDSKPLLIVDEANKLRASSLRLFIPLFNKLHHEAGMVLLGAHDLKKIIQTGVRRDQRGFDELESRLGRTYWSLAGIFRKDVVAICEANGIADDMTHERIWNRLIPEKRMIDGKYHLVAKLDLRVLETAVIHERAQAERNSKRVIVVTNQAPTNGHPDHRRATV